MKIWLLNTYPPIISMLKLGFEYEIIAHSYPRMYSLILIHVLNWTLVCLINFFCKKGPLETSLLGVCFVSAEHYNSNCWYLRKLHVNFNCMWWYLSWSWAGLPFPDCKRNRCHTLAGIAGDALPFHEYRSRPPGLDVQEHWKTPYPPFTCNRTTLSSGNES